MANLENDNGWQEWGKYVLRELGRLNEWQEKAFTAAAQERADIRKELAVLHREVRGDIASLKTEVEMLKLKSGLWGFAAGAVPVLILVIMKAFGY